MQIRTKQLAAIGILAGMMTTGAVALTSEGDPLPNRGATGQSSANDLEQQFMQIQTELQQVSSQLQPIQQEAQNRPEVKQSLLSYDVALTETMAQISPGQAEDIRLRGQLFAELVQAGDPAELNEAEVSQFQQSAQEFQNLRESLGDLEMQAQSSDAVRAEFSNYQDVFMSAVVDIEPRAEALLERQVALQRALMELRQQTGPAVQ
jgi:peptidoglycan hydrolase CwlO-like protein